MKNRIFLVVGVILLVAVTVAAVSQPLASPKSSNLSLPARPIIKPAADQSYEALETMRVLNGFSFSSYDMLEQVRSGRGLSADRSYDKIEAIRFGR